jgi:transcriptional repressor NrdR
VIDRKWGAVNCPYCGFPDSKVIDSRETESKEAIRRRRECVGCGQRFTTYEKIEEIPITVVKRDGSTQLFHADKLLHGLMRACAKRNVPLETLEGVVVDIERELREESAYEVTSERVGKMVLERLQGSDDCRRAECRCGRVGQEALPECQESPAEAVLETHREW